MNNYSKQKRKQLVLVGLLAAMAIGGVWFGLIKFQKEGLERLAEKKAAAEKNLKMVKLSIENADQLDAELKEANKTVAQLEEGMASGDLYSWAINTIRQFKLPYKVEIPQFSQIDGPKDSTLLANFPYKQATLTIGGTAQYQDLGRFIADFENNFPFMRMMNLTLEPASSLLGNEREKLAFKIDIAALIKPNAS
jgi:Tfp pilus assembly protein PilO